MTDAWVLLLLAGLWIACGVAAYGMAFAYFQRKWPRFAERDESIDRLVATVTSLAGPIGLAIVLGFAGFRYGWKL